MTNTSDYIFVIIIGALAAFASLTWIHTYGVHKARMVRKKQRADDRQAFINTYHNTALALLCTQPLICYYNERVNKKQVRIGPLFESLPKQCWIAHDGCLLGMDTRLAIQWALEFSALRAALVGDCLRALDKALWPPDPDPEAAKRRHSCGPVIYRISEYLYGLVHPLPVYQYSRKIQ